jgi:chromate reductase
MTSRILLVSGSLRRRSTNTAVLRTAANVAPTNVETVLYAGLGELPQFNPDDDAGPLQGAVEDLRANIHAADAILFSTPEYAGGLPGSFKNLLDWTIGDDQPNSILAKPVAWINCSPRGATDAIASLRTVLSYAHAAIVEEACADVPLTSNTIGADGFVLDPLIRTTLRRTVIALIRSVEPNGTTPG